LYKIVGTVVQYEQRLTEKISHYHLKVSLNAFVNKFQRVTDYLLQHLQRLLEPFWQISDDN
jgi:hypothetical protein